MSKQKKTPKFKEFEGGLADTVNYEPPKYLVQPATGDTGFALVSQAFRKQKAYFEPKIKTQK
jgi:hypothetical protein